MPKISDQHREMRRMQILEAAWRCFYRRGVEATTIEEIIGESGLSASAMYRYFGGKDDIIRTAVATSMGKLAVELAPLFSGAIPTTPSSFVQRAIEAIERFSAREGYNLMSLAIHGWSLAQHDEAVRGILRDFFLQIRGRLRERAAAWQQQGQLAPGASAEDVAQALQSLLLGYVVQATIVRDASAGAHARALEGLSLLVAVTPGGVAAPAAPPAGAHQGGAARTGGEASRATRRRRAARSGR